jgi:hypothetical protein
LLKASNNTTSLDDQELRDLLRDEEAQQQQGGYYHNKNINDRRAFFETPQKQLFGARVGGILKTPGTANNRQKNVSFAPGNTQFSNPLYSSSLENSVLKPLPYKQEKEAVGTRPPITPLKPNESTFRGLPGRFPKSMSETHKDEDDPFVSTKNILEDASFLNYDNALGDNYDLNFHGNTKNTDLKFKQFQKRPATPGPARRQTNSPAVDEKTQALFQTIADQLLENNKNLAHLKQNTSLQKQEFLLQNIELREQVAECAQLLKIALEERQNAVDYAYEKDQECLALKTQLAEERRKNIRLMELAMQTQNPAMGATTTTTTNENYDFTRRRLYNFSNFDANNNNKINNDNNVNGTERLGANRPFNNSTRGELPNNPRQPAYTFKRSTKPASTLEEPFGQAGTVQSRYSNNSNRDLHNTRPTSLFRQRTTTESAEVGDRRTNRDRLSAYQPRGASTHSMGNGRDSTTFDRDHAYRILKALRRQAYELQLRYGDSKPMTAVTDALDRAPSSRHQTDYASLAATLQQQLILLQLPETPQVAGFIAKIRELLAMIS